MRTKVSLGEVAFIRTGKLDANAQDVNGKYPFFTCGEENLTINEPAFDTEAVLLAGNGNFSVKYYKGKFNAYQRTYVIEPNNVDGKWLYYLVSHHIAKITGSARGSTIKYLRISDITDCPVNLVSLNEQHRIVAKIEELFSELDKGIEALKTAREQLKVYRQAVLKHAFEGKLTAKWREQNQDKLESPEQLLARIQQEREAHYQQQLQDWKAAVKAWEKKGKDEKKPSKPKQPKGITPISENELSKLASLPNKWKWVPWEEILEYGDDSFKRGPFGSALTKSIFVDAGYKIYEQYCPINDDPYFVRYYITPEKYEELIQFAVKEGDFLISCSGVTLGRITQVPDDFEEGVINQALLRLRLNRRILLDQFFVKFFRATYFQERIFSKSQGAAIPNVKGVKELKAIPVPLVPLKEQEKVIEKLDQYLSVLDELDEQAILSLSKAETLRQSILKKAFSGQLVPQDPNDEPASALLERIRAEREEQPKKPRKAQRRKPLQKSVAHG
ncbi:MAG: restriction endonuclease subunit S [Gammaproteobacteria bacterium]|nr:MAG: restriction endonuclease subunit S [Gammaproteobacteria bacterium]TNF09557.1 MAG: restriction endonuclease subunit S [Gammaproteobacteria bacterium]